MRAIVARSYGGPQVLKLEDVPEPRAGDDDLLIRVHASTVATSSSFMRRGVPRIARLMTGLIRPKYPIPGTDLAGVVERVGGSVKSFVPGDRVIAASDTKFSAHAELVALPESAAVVKMPAGMEFAEAASLCEGPVTALAFLRDHGRVGPKSRLLVNGASGAIGTAAVQLGKHFGARVTGVCSAQNIELVRSLGADEVIDYRVRDFTEAAERYDLIFDTVGKSSFRRARRALDPGGTYLCPVLSAGLLFHMLWTARFGRRKAVFAATGLRSAEDKRRDMELLNRLAEAGELRPVVDRSYPLEQAAEAASYVDGGHKRGNVVLIMDPAYDVARQADAERSAGTQTREMGGSS